MNLLDRWNSCVCSEDRGTEGWSGGSDSLAATGSCLFLAGSVRFMVLCGASGARNNSPVKLHFRTEQSYLCPACFQTPWKKNKVWTDGRIFLFHFPLVNLTSSFVRGMFVFHTWTFFPPRYKIQYLKVGAGKVDQIILTLIPQMCLFIHVWNIFFPQMTVLHTPGIARVSCSFKI